MKVNCPSCNQKYNINQSMFGETIPCNACDFPMVFHAPASEEPQPNHSTKITCPDCNQKYSINESQFGSEIKCQVCSTLILIDRPKHVPKGKAPSNSPTTPPILATPPKIKGTSIPLASSKRSNPLITVFAILALIGLAVFHFIQSQQPTNISNNNPTKKINPLPLPLPAENTKTITVKPSVAALENAFASEDNPPDTTEPDKSPHQDALSTAAIPDSDQPLEKVTNNKGELMISHFDTVVRPFTEKHCIKCHGPDKEKGNFRIDKLMNSGLVRSEADAEHWQEALDLINTGEMPPIEEDQPTKDEMTAILGALYQTTGNARDVIASKNSGFMRRLNSREYINSINDLLGISLPEKLIPEDSRIFGFDTFTKDLSTSPAELQGYIDANSFAINKLTADYAAGQKIPQEATLIFKNIPKEPKNSHAYHVFKRFIDHLYKHQPAPDSMIKDMTTLFNYNRKKGASFWEAASVSITCALSSPHFVYILEKETQLTQLEIANRLSLLLWSSIPDQALIDLANQGTLTQPDIYAQQFERMIKDQKAQRFFSAFTEQWLELDRLASINIDENVFPILKKQEDSLKRDMTKETQAFMRQVILDNMPAKNLVTANFTMLNKELAQHYNLNNANVTQHRFTKVKLKGDDKVRGGILGQGAIQMLTSNGSRTSPVERGVFILRKLLDSPPPPAPANVPEAEDVPGENQTTRELLQHHMTTAQCAACHAKIDPLGFGMESFGPLGRWRTHEGKQLIDTSGQMTNGSKFEGYQGLITNLAASDERIAKSFVKAIMSYAIGREIRYTDRGHIDQIIKSSKANDFKLKDLILMVIKSKTFQTKS